MGAHLATIPNPEILKGINPWWWGLFHSVSAFNNAGFGLMNDNLMSFVVDPVISLTIAALIILGGLGYPVLIGIHAGLRRAVTSRNTAEQMQLDKDVAEVTASTLQTKIALYGTFGLLTVGTVFMLFMDWNNPVMADYTLSQKIMISFFQSVSTRTAGFNTVDIGALNIVTIFIFMILMYIGANPAGTAGGIKIPTVAVLYGYIKDWFKAPGQAVELFGRKVSKFAVSHAIRLFFFSIIFITVVTTLILIAEKDYLATPDPTFNFVKILFELFLLLER